MMNRRELVESMLGLAGALAIPSIALAEAPLKKSVDMTWFGPHHGEFDNNDARICTAQRMFGTLCYGSCHPEIILSPRRMVGAMWYSIMPSQRFKAERPWLYAAKNTTKGFMFCGAKWLSNDYLDDQVIFINDWYPRMEGEDTWKKFNGWYRAPRSVMDDPFFDEIFERIQMA